VGIALAFIGTALVYYAGAANAGEIAVNWSTLRGAAASLNRHVIRVAFVFMRGLLRAAPWTGALFVAGILALVGLPPFALFVSEFIIFRAGMESNPWAAAIGVLLLVIIFGGMLASVNRMLYGDPPAALTRGDPLRLWLAPLALNFALLIVLGLALPPPFVAALKQALQVLGV